MESEKELAAYYQAHRGDPNVWDELEEAPEPTPDRRGGLSVSIAVRFSPEEAEAIRRTARLEKKTYSEVVRTAVHRYTQPDTMSLSTGNISLTGMGTYGSQTQRDPVPSSVDMGAHADVRTVSSGVAITAR